jgi:hypothetical protein
MIPSARSLVEGMPARGAARQQPGFGESDRLKRRLSQNRRF